MKFPLGAGPTTGGVATTSTGKTNDRNLFHVRRFLGTMFRARSNTNVMFPKDGEPAVDVLWSIGKVLAIRLPIPPISPE